MERVGISRVFVYLVAIASFIAGGLLFSFLCREFDLNVWNDADDTHVLEFDSKTTYEVNTRSVALPEARADIIKGKPLSDSDKIVLINHRGIQSHSIRKPDVEQSNTKEGLSEWDTAGTVRKVDVSRSDKVDDTAFRIKDSVEWVLSQDVVTPDTSFIHKQEGKYYISFIADCWTKSIYDFRLTSTPVEVVTITKHTTDVVIKRPWLRISPEIGTNAFNASQWFAKVNLAIRYGDFWVNGAAEIPMQKDLNLSLPVSLEYDLITLER